MRDSLGYRSSNVQISLSANIIYFVCVFLIATICGISVVLFGAISIIPVIGVFAGAFLLFLPMAKYFWAMCLITLLLVGQLIYFARIEQASWIPFLIGLAGYVRLPLELLHKRRNKDDVFRPVRSPVIIAAIFLFVSLFSIALNRSSPIQGFIGSKDYLWLLSLLFLIGCSPLRFDTYTQIFKWLAMLLWIQIPFVLYQALVIVPRRTAGAEWDAVVGAFGGDPNGGGASGALALYAVLGLLTTYVLLKENIVTKKFSLITTISALMIFSLAEVKVIFLIIPLSFLLYFYPKLFKNPIKGLFFILSGALILAGMFMFYFKNFGENAAQRDMGTYMERIWDSTVDPNLINLKTGEIGRIAAITFWWKEQSREDLGHILFGHGVGATKIGNVVVGNVAARYPFNVGRSSFVLLLWEVGIVGTTLFCFLLAWGAWVGLSTPQNLATADPNVYPLIRLSGVALALVICLLIYNTDAVALPAVQLLSIISVACVAELRIAPNPRAVGVRRD